MHQGAATAGDRTLLAWANVRWYRTSSFLDVRLMSLAYVLRVKMITRCGAGKESPPIRLAGILAWGFNFLCSVGQVAC